MQDFRVIDLPERTTLDSSDYTMIDSAENGTNKYLLSRQAAETDAKIAAAVEDIEDGIAAVQTEITDLRTDFENILVESSSTSVEEITPTMTSGAIQTDGRVVPSSAYNYTNIISVLPGDIVYCFNNTTGVNFRSAYYYVDGVYANAYDVTAKQTFTVPSGVNGVAFNVSSSYSTPNVKVSREIITYTPDVELTQPGKAADAQATGDAISDVTSRVYDAEVRSSISINPLRLKPFWSHTFIVASTTPNAEIIIPNQSLAHINAAHRLGYNVIECNLLKTSDGHFVCLHGTGGKFGWEFMHIDGVTDISNTAINSVTLDWIQANVRCRSKYAKYQVAPLTVEAFLHECKKYNIIPVITGTSDSIPIIDSIMGKDNYIAYANSRICSAPIFTTSYSAETASDIIDYCDAIGAPVLYSLLDYADYTDNELNEIVTALHENGYYAVYPECYMSLTNIKKLQNAGFDFAPSDKSVNLFESGNICNLFGDITFDDFSTDGTVNSGVLKLTSGNQIAPSNEIPSVFLGKCFIAIRFTGTINLTIGRFPATSFTSDGTEDLVISSYVIESAPTFAITATNNVDVTSLTFKSSKV